MERGHRAHGLLLVAPNGQAERFITRDDPPRDFTVTWWPHSSALLNPREASDFARSMQYEQLQPSADACDLGPLGELVTTELLRNIDDEVPALTLPFDEEHREAAARFLDGIE